MYSTKLSKNNKSVIPKKQIAIRCLTITEKGFGNFNRCLTIAESLQKNNVHVSFIIDYNKSIIDILKNRKFNFLYLKKPNLEYNGILNFLERNNINTILIDMREYSESLSKILAKKDFQIIILDDAWCKNIHGDILFNGTNASNYQNYNVINKNSKLYLGTEYWLINQNFKKFKKKVIDIKSKKKYSVLISMGGSDKNDLTNSIAQSLLLLNSINLSVVIGPLYSNISNLKKLNKNKKLKLIQNPKNIWKEFSSSDVVVSNGGNTLFELAALGIPTLSIPAFPHEVEFAKQFMMKGFSINLGFKQKNTKKINQNLVNLLEDIPLRKQMCINGRKLVDGNGLLRVTKIILKSIS